MFDPRYVSFVCRVIATLAVMMAPVPAGAQYADEKPAFKLSDCDQDQLATLALRACGALLNAPDLDDTSRARLYILRGKAWLSEQEPGEAATDFSMRCGLNRKTSKLWNAAPMLMGLPVSMRKQRRIGRKF